MVGGGVMAIIGWGVTMEQGGRGREGGGRIVRVMHQLKQQGHLEMWLCSTSDQRYTDRGDKETRGGRTDKHRYRLCMPPPNLRKQTPTTVHLFIFGGVRKEGRRVWS